MKKVIFSILKYLGTFLAVIIVFNCCLYLSCLFPSNIIEEHAKESSDILVEQGMFYQLSSVFNITNNNCTDSVIINESYAIDNEHPYESYMKARKNYQKGLTNEELEDINGEGVTVNYLEEYGGEAVGYDYDPIGELNDFLYGRINTSLNYARYWHGYLILFRPLLILFNISQIRILLFIVFTSLFIYFMFLLNKRFHKNVAIIFGLSLLCSGYFSASFSLESSPVFLTMMISLIILLKRIDKIKDFSLYLFIIACIANFVDYLTVPLITLGMLCGLYILKLLENGKDWKYCARFLIFHSIVWITGYACTWVSKWILYDLTIDNFESMLNIGFTQSFYRMTRDNDYALGETNYFNTIYKILSNSSFFILVSLWIMMAINKFKINLEKFNKNAIPFLLLSLLPVGWYIALANHTMLHAYFTYRHSLVFMLGILLAINELLFQKNMIKKH